MEPNSPITQETSQARPGWWVWSAWLPDPAGPQFVYGCAAECHHSPGWSQDSTIQLKDTPLVICQTVVTAAAFSQFAADLSKGFIRLDQLQAGGKPAQKIAATRKVLQKCLGHGRAQATVHYTLPDTDTWPGDGRVLEDLLPTLQGELNLPFKEQYAGRLGNFEIFHLAPWLEASSPVLVELTGDKQGELGARTLEICRTTAFASQAHIAHLVCRTHQDVIFDSIVRLTPGVTRTAISLHEAPDELELWIFEEGSGTILFHEQSHFIRQVGMVMGVMGRSVTIQDDLSTRAKQQGGHKAKQIQTVTSVSPQRTIIGADKPGSWRAFSQNLRSVAQQHTASAQNDRWFPKGIEGEIGAITHLNSLLNGGQIEQAVLVDPWFGVQSVSRLALRLSSTNLHLTIITSWTTKDPDTNNTVANQQDPTSELNTSLNRVRQQRWPRKTEQPDKWIPCSVGA